MSKVAVNCPKCKEVLLLENEDEVYCKCGNGPFAIERRSVGFRAVVPKNA